MRLAQVIDQLLSGIDLSTEEAESLMRFLTGGEASEAQIGAVLVALKAGVVSGATLAAFAKVLRHHAMRVEADGSSLLDTCGTGGGCPSFNISTAAAIVAASAGAKVAKHGNRGMSSPCGSADVLEAAGVRIGGDAEQLLHVLEATDLVFLFAQTHHPAMKHVARARREIGVRTVFNLLGPLLNPAGAARQIIGVYDAAFLEPIGDALARLGTKKSWVVRGEDGLDEISPCSPTQLCEVADGQVLMRTLPLSEFGLESLSKEHLEPGPTPEANCQILIEAISDVNSSRSAAILPSAAAALYVSGVAQSLKDGVARARQAIATGAAKKKLEALILATNTP